MACALGKCATLKKNGKALSDCSNTTKRRHKLIDGSSVRLPDSGALSGCELDSYLWWFGDLIMD